MSNTIDETGKNIGCKAFFCIFTVLGMNGSLMLYVMFSSPHETTWQ